MSRSIWKFVIQPDQRGQLIHIPRLPAEPNPLLTVQVQNDEICLWALVETQQQSIEYQIDVVGTGEAALYSRKSYVGTVQQGPWVWHVFGWPTGRQD